ALEGVALDERALQRVEVAVPGEALDRDDLGALVRDGEREAGVGAAAVDQDRAGAALPVVAGLLRAGQAESLAQEVEQGGPRVDLQRVLLAVDAQRDLDEDGRHGEGGTRDGRS